MESHLSHYASGEGLLLASVDLQQQPLPQCGVVLLVWQPQVPQDIVATCLALPPSTAADANLVRGLLLVDASPSLTLSVTHKALEATGLHSIARKPAVLLPRAASGPQAAMQALSQLAVALPPPHAPQPEQPLRAPATVRIAVARDDAFGPCFQENLVLLQQAGAQLLFFSPLYDTGIPSGVACLYLSSGPLEPERWQQLANNRPLLASVRAFCDAGGLVLAEGSGLIYMSRTVDLDEDDGAHKHRVYDMAAVLPFKARLLPEPTTSAVQLRVSAGNPLLQPGSQPRGYLCSDADLVLVEERPLQGLGLGLHSKPGSQGAKGAQAHLSTTYEVRLVPPDTQQASAEEEEGEQDVGSTPEGFTLQNVLASRCFVYLPSVPGLAAHLVRRCACIDVAVLAAGMAHHLSAANPSIKSQLQSTLTSANASRAGSRRQSIQDVSALCAAYNSNGGVGGGCAGAASGGLHGSPAGCVAGHAGQQHFFSSPPGQGQGAGSALPPRGPSCASIESGGACTAPPTCMPSPRQSPLSLPHSNSAANISSCAAPPRRSGAFHPSDLPPIIGGKQQDCSGMQGGVQGMHPSQVPSPARACRSGDGYSGGRASVDHGPAPGACGVQGSQAQQEGKQCGVQPPDRYATASPCSAAFKACDPGMGATEPAHAGEGVPAPELLPSDSPLRLNGHPSSMRQLPGMGRSSSCSAGSVVSLAPAGDRSLCGGGGGGPGPMHHAASTSSLGSCGRGAAAAGAPDLHFAGFRRGASEDVGPSYPPYGPGAGWPPAAASQMPGAPGWSPGLATSGWSHGSLASAYGPPVGAASSSGHGSVVCCAPGACEAIVAMGLANRLAGIGFDCDHPPDVCASRRVVIRWVAPEEAPQGPAARGVLVVRPCAVSLPSHAGSGAGGGGGGGRCGRTSDDRHGVRGGRVLLLDELALRQEPPGVLVLPDLGELSEVERAQLEKALVDTGLCSPGGGPGGSCALLHVTCRTLVDVMDLMLELGAVAGEPQAASMLLERLQARLRRVAAAAAAAAAGPRLVGPAGLSPLPGGGGRTPRVLVLQSLSPLVEPGRWVPEMLSMVGATSCLALPGGPDVQLTWQDIRERAAPDMIIILTPPGNADARVVAGTSGSPATGASSQVSDGLGCLAEQISLLAAQPGWWCLPAVRVSQVYLMQASFCVRPGPRLVDGVELLARLLMPGQYGSSRKVPAGAVMRLSLAAGQRCRATLLASYFKPVQFG